MHLDYCSTICDGCPVSKTKKLCSLQKQATKFIGDKHKSQATYQNKHLGIPPLKNSFLFNKAHQIYTPLSCIRKL